MRRNAITTALAAAALFLSASQVIARERHKRAVPPAVAPAPAASSFYPQDIEGGVSGNYSFNNQIRKLRDPLNANGGR